MINRWRGKEEFASSIGHWALQGTQLEAVLNTEVYFCLDDTALTIINWNQDFS